MCKITFMFVILGISYTAVGKLVIDVADLHTLDAGMLEREATLVEKTVREGSCEGAKVLTFLYSTETKYLCTGRSESV